MSSPALLLLSKLKMFTNLVSKIITVFLAKSLFEYEIWKIMRHKFTITKPQHQVRNIPSLKFTPLTHNAHQSYTVSIIYEKT